MSAYISDQRPSANQETILTSAAAGHSADGNAQFQDEFHNGYLDGYKEGYLKGLLKFKELKASGQLPALQKEQTIHAQQQQNTSAFKQAMGTHIKYTGSKPQAQAQAQSEAQRQAQPEAQPQKKGWLEQVREKVHEVEEKAFNKIESQTQDFNQTSKPQDQTQAQPEAQPQKKGWLEQVREKVNEAEDKAFNKIESQSKDFNQTGKQDVSQDASATRPELSATQPGQQTPVRTTTGEQISA